MLYAVDNFPYAEIQAAPAERRKKGNPRSRRGMKYKAILSGFDIETSRLPDRDESYMYIWQWHFEEIGTMIGRTWGEFSDAVNRILDALGEYSLVCLVHNLSYEAVFIQYVYQWRPQDVFAVRPRHIAKAIMRDHLEFRCTLLHSNMSLSAWLRKMGVEHQKLDGDEFDYDARRYADTILTDRQLQYCVNDVVGMVEAYRAEMIRDHMNLYEMPLTSTGYVRADVRRAMHDCGGTVYNLAPSYKVYQLLRLAFRGGDTHCNRFFSGQILQNVHSADRSSSYPDIICNCKFPMTKFRWIQSATVEKVMDHIDAGHAVLMQIRLWDVTLRDPLDGFPYIPYSKCTRCLRAGRDNGRIINADFLEISITDVDFGIILEQYDFSDAQIVNAYWSHYGELPRPFIETVISYYKAKTELKGSSDPFDLLLYEKSKNLLNSTYGLTAQDPVKQSVYWINGDWSEGEEDPETLLLRNNRRACVVYQWGVWITAWARLRLREGIRLCSADHVKSDCIYVDTDSCKYIGTVDWSEYNKERERDSRQSGAWAVDRHGQKHFMGVYEEEATYTRFLSHGSKKYAYTYADGYLPELNLYTQSACHVTIAGVNKRKGGEELEAAGGLEAFREGFVFVAAGGTESVYNDHTPIHTEIIDGHVVELGPNVCIRPSTYTVSLTDEYREVLAASAQLRKIFFQNI